jgi:hypothetical protein
MRRILFAGATQAMAMQCIEQKRRNRPREGS